MSSSGAPCQYEPIPRYSPDEATDNFLFARKPRFARDITGIRTQRILGDDMPYLTVAKRSESGVPAGREILRSEFRFRQHDRR